MENMYPERTPREILKSKIQNQCAQGNDSLENYTFF